MELMKLRIFQRQIALQCDFLLIAAEKLEKYIARGGMNTTAVFFSIQ
jgi:hypothetical protein